MSDLAIIRRNTGGTVIIEAPEGRYRLSKDDIRDILFYGHRVSVDRDEGDSEDTRAIVFGKRPGFNGARRIFFCTPSRCFSIADLSFVSVVKGKWSAASMVADPLQAADHVA